MIKQLPGWLNFFLLWAFYCAVFAFVDAIFYWTGYYPQMHWLLDAFCSCLYAGAYLAKWRFYDYDGGWRFR